MIRRLLVCLLLFTLPLEAVAETVRFTAAPGGTYYAYPLGTSLATWTSNRVALTESASPNTGLYSGTLDDSIADDWVIFSGSSQPADYNQGAALVSLSVLNVKGKVIGGGAKPIAGVGTWAFDNAGAALAKSSQADSMSLAIVAAASAADQAAANANDAEGAADDASQQAIAAYGAAVSAAAAATSANTKIGTPATTLAEAIDGIEGSGGDAPTVEQIKTKLEESGSSIYQILAKTDNLPPDPADQSALANTLGGMASDLSQIENGGIVIPVNQVRVGPGRTWKLKQTDAGLVGEIPITTQVSAIGKLFDIDFSADLPTNGQLIEINSVEIIEGDADGLVFGADIQEADDYGVDKPHAKLRIVTPTAGTYTIRCKAANDDSDGGGESVGDVILIVKP